MQRVKEHVNNMATGTTWDEAIFEAVIYDEATQEHLQHSLGRVHQDVIQIKTTAEDNHRRLEMAVADNYRRLEAQITTLAAKIEGHSSGL
jgi:hypothetical protein